MKLTKRQKSKLTKIAKRAAVNGVQSATEYATRSLVKAAFKEIKKSVLS